jgi:GH18 family chitinase
MNRRKPLERQGNANDITKTSILTPSWMQIAIAPEAKNKGDSFKGVTFSNVRKDQNMTFLAEKDQPQKSVFGIGGWRHNVPFADMADAAMKRNSFQPVRAHFEWKEDITRQKYDSSPITAKIGAKSPIHTTH